MSGIAIGAASPLGRALRAVGNAPTEATPPAEAPNCADVAALRTFVVFSGRTDLAWLRLLRPGFRHCFLVIHDGRHWLSLDPLATFMDLAVQPVPAEFDLPAWYRDQGFVVVPAALDRSRRRPAPWAPFTCVEAVKRVLGLHDRWVLTPFQLYRKLRDQGSGIRSRSSDASDP